MKNNIKLIELETRIEVLEREIRNLKGEVEILKATEVTDITTEEVKINVEAEEVFATTIEELELSIRAFYCLKHAGINTLKDFTTLSKEELYNVRNLGKTCALEVIEKVGNLPLDFESAKKLAIKAKRVSEKRRIKEEQKRRLALKLSESFAVALEVYAKIEEQADKEGIKWYHMSSTFHRKYRKFKMGKGRAVAKETIGGIPLLESYDCDYFMSDEHPKMKELVTTEKEKITTEMCIEAILEDFRASNKGMKPRTKTYQQYALRFIEIANNFKK